MHFKSTETLESYSIHKVSPVPNNVQPRHQPECGLEELQAELLRALRGLSGEVTEVYIYFLFNYYALITSTAAAH